LQDYRQLDVVVSGDGQCDSPGKCAKFWYYTLMETNKNLILLSETMDKTEIQNNSCNMEREAANPALICLKGSCGDYNECFDFCYKDVWQYF